ncbi:MAG: STAS/SEC14 domain-containing protein [Erythrobacter sp.]|jgi:hypothetical protein|nr:STAS/SEC14 domain-containing protein [Erythrobacter sp.]
MNTIENVQSAQLLEDRCEVHFVCGGFWDTELMAKFLALLDATCKPLVKAGKPIYALGDFSKALPQDRATAAMVSDHLVNARKAGLKRVAIVGATALMKIQYKRVSAGMEVEYFDTTSAALTWLREGR